MAASVENEFKYVLKDWAEVERAMPDDAEIGILEAGYLSEQARIRRETWMLETSLEFTFKQYLADGSCIEIPCDLDDGNFDVLWEETKERLRKRRYALSSDRDKWFVDFFLRPDSSVYFVMAEVEVPKGEKKPDLPHPAIARFVAFEPDRSLGDAFSSRKLSNEEHAATIVLSLGIG